MIPYFEQPSFTIGPITIHAFGVIVATAVLVGLELGRRRFRRLGLDPHLGEGLAWYAVIGGFLGAHLFSVLFYFPDEVAKNPLLLLKFWEDISSFGGMIGGLIAIWLFLRLKTADLDRRARLLYLDAIAFVFPFALMIGRIACSLAHDHPGTVTRFPLAVSLESPEAQTYIVSVYRSAGRLTELPPPAHLSYLGFHDLGWYEFLYLSVVVVPLFLLLDRRARPAGFFTSAFLLLYLPVRFGLDFLRVNDVRYLGLTPAQFVAAAALLALPLILTKVRAGSSVSVRRASHPPGGDHAAGPPDSNTT